MLDPPVNNAERPLPPQGFPPKMPDQPLNIVERLPEELRLWTFQYLTFQDAIRLSQVSRYFHHNIKPQSWPVQEKSDFVFGHQHSDRHNQSFQERSPGPGRRIFTRTNDFACFNCFRVLPREKFSRSKTVRGYSKSSAGKHSRLRYCLECGMRDSKYPAGTVLENVISEVMYLDGKNFVVEHDCDQLLLCQLCNAFNVCQQMSPPGRCSTCKTYGRISPASRPNASCRGKITVRCGACNVVQIVRDPSTSHIDCKICFKVRRLA